MLFIFECYVTNIFSVENNIVKSIGVKVFIEAQGVIVYLIICITNMFFYKLVYIM